MNLSTMAVDETATHTMIETSVLPGYKQTEMGVIPENWAATPLGDLFSFKNGLNKAKEYFGYGTPIVNYMDVYNHSGIHIDDFHGKVSVSKQELASFGVNQGDVFFTRTSETVEEVGIAAVMLDAPTDTVFSGFVLRARPKDSRLDNEFKKFCFSSMFVRNQITSKSTYTTRALTNGRVLSTVMLPHPPLPEQRAIAAALSEVDALIASQEQQIAKQRDIKTATMQLLLSGKQRLPGVGRTVDYKQTDVGVIPQDWLCSSLDDVADVIMGQSPVGSSYNKMGDGIPLINGPTEFTDRTPIKIQWTNTPTKLCRYGDLLLCVRGSSTGRMNVANDIYCIGRGVAAIRAKTTSNTEYLTYQVEQGISRLLSLSAGSTFPNVDGKSIRSILIPLPEVGEQTAIASVIADMDAHIAALEAQRDKTKAIKQGMMQQLLTGRIRL